MTGIAMDCKLYISFPFTIPEHGIRTFADCLLGDTQLGEYSASTTDHTAPSVWGCGALEMYDPEYGYDHYGYNH